MQFFVIISNWGHLKHFGRPLKTPSALKIMSGETKLKFSAPHSSPRCSGMFSSSQLNSDVGSLPH